MWTPIAFFIVALTALFLSPEVARETRDDGCIIEAPQAYVREKVLNHDFMTQLQSNSKNPHLIMPLLAQQGVEPNIIRTTALDSLVGDTIILSSSNPQKPATVLRNTPRTFQFKEPLSWGQRITHTMTFTPTSLPSQNSDHTASASESVEETKTSSHGPLTTFEHQRVWEGSLVHYFLRVVEMVQSSGDGAWGGEASMTNTGTEVVRVAVGEAWALEGEGVRTRYLVDE